MPIPVILGHKLSKCNDFILYSYHELLQDLTIPAYGEGCRCFWDGSELSSEKSKTMITSKSCSKQPSIEMNYITLEEVNTFKYLGATISSDGQSITEIKSRIALATGALSNLTVRKSSKISFNVKFKLYNTLVLSILLYGCDSWTLWIRANAPSF